MPQVLAEAKTKTNGLSSFASTPATAGPDAIAPLIAQLSEYLTEQGISKAEVPVAMLATAGMRNVQDADEDAAQSIMASTAATIAASGFPTAANRILPGVQEVSLAWHRRMLPSRRLTLNNLREPACNEFGSRA